MRTAFQRIFWGFIIVYVEIHYISVDILPDPIGYYLIFSGLALLVSEYPESRKAMNTALALLVISIPGIFISNNEANEMNDLSGVDLYLFGLSILNLLLIYFIFNLMLQISIRNVNEQLERSTRIIFLLYMFVSISSLIVQPFLWGYDAIFLFGISIATGILSFVMHILFLVQLWKFQNVQDFRHKPPANWGSVIG